MPRALFTGASGMAAQQTNIDVIANNIANVNTTGFKRQRVNFQDLFYDIVQAPGSANGDQGLTPAGVEIGNGVMISSTPRNFTAGNIEPTGVDTNIAIEGDGFFTILMPDGTESYTRAGDFLPDTDGNLVTPDGYLLQPQITIPDQTVQVSVSTTGEVTALTNGVQSVVGNITLTRFQNPAGLVGLGRNMFGETAASGTPQTGSPGDVGFGLTRGGAIEGANIEIVNELVNMIVAQRAFEMNSKAVRTSEEMMRTANDIIR